VIEAFLNSLARPVQKVGVKHFDLLTNEIVLLFIKKTFGNGGA
jgi:hypothetical protein